MKIAIFYDLEKGGAWETVKQNVKHLLNLNAEIHLFTTKNDELEKKVKNYKVYKNPVSKNLISDLLNNILVIRKNHKKIAESINNSHYDLILVYPSLVTQSPYVLRFLTPNNIKKTIYFMHESKREFYENTSFDYYQLKKIISRLIRLPIKYIDRKNCSYAIHIVSNSLYSRYLINKIYNKNSFVIYPGMKPTIPGVLAKNNNKKIISVGIFSKIKGHHYSINQISPILSQFSILGRKSNEFTYIQQLAKKKNIKINILNTENYKIKNSFYSKNSIFLANQINEPFGLTTLEATDNKCFVLGLNLGGTSEIIRHGLNGLLYPQYPLSISKKILKQILSQKKIKIIQPIKTDWKETTLNILKYYQRYIKNEPNY